MSSTPRNHLADLTPEFWASRGFPVQERKDDEPRSDEYTRALEMVSQPKAMAALAQAVMAAPAPAPAATTSPEKFSIVSANFEFPKDDDFNSFLSSKDPVTELAEELWRREKALFPKFLQLPVEIREMVYEEALRNGKHFNVPLSLNPSSERLVVSYVDRYFPGIRPIPRVLDGPRPPPLLPALCLTNKVEHRIATMVLVRGAGILLRRDGDAEAMEKYLASIGTGSGSSVVSIKKAELEYGTEHRKILRWNTAFDADFEFLGKLSKLRDITITVPAMYWDDHPVPEGRMQLLPDELGTKFNLTQLQACAMLQRFVLIIPPGWRYSCPETWPASLLVKNLKQVAWWLKHNVLPGPTKDICVKLVYISGLEAPFLTPESELVPPNRIFPRSVKGISLERAPESWGITLGDGV